MTIMNHVPVLQVLVPFFAALFAILTFNKFVSWLIATIGVALSLTIGIYAELTLKETVFYSFGDWFGAFGIEYRLDSLNKLIIIYINGVLLFFLLFGKELINKTITKYIDHKKQHMFYGLLLFTHAGYLGVLSSNDLFNIYVFTEISSLGAYVLMSKGRNPKALIGSFDYLIVGSIGATLILISIGFLFALTGSLNISDISDIIQNNSNLRNAKILIVAIAFFISGVVLKMAFFPLHFWMIRAYNATASFILTYLAAISTMLGVYLIMRLMYFTIDAKLIYIPFSLTLNVMSMIAIILCSYLALKSKNIKSIVIYSSGSQIGYILLLLSVVHSDILLFQFLILDSINKVGLFILIAHIENKTENLCVDSLKQIKNSNLFKIFAAFVIIFSTGLPITSMFFVKVKLFELLIKQNLIIEFVVVLLASIIGFLYHMKFAKAIFFNVNSNGVIEIDTNVLGLGFIVVIQVMTLFYMTQVPNFLILANM